MAYDRRVGNVPPKRQHHDAAYAWIRAGRGARA